MSNLFFPTDLPGLTWEGRKVPVFQTLVGSSDGGREVTDPLPLIMPLYRWEFTYSYVKQGRIGPDGASGLNELMGFVEYLRGEWDDFLYRDPDHNGTEHRTSATRVNFATVPPNRQAIYQLVQPTGNGQYLEYMTDWPVVTHGENPILFPGDSEITIYVNGVAQTWNGIPGFGLNLFNKAGQIIFGNGVPGNVDSPPAGAILAWSGNFYYRAHFVKPPSFVNFMSKYWSTQVVIEVVPLFPGGY